MNKRFSIIISLCLGCAIPLAVIAEPQGPKRGGVPGAGPGGNGRTDREEWRNRTQQAEEFYKKHAPHRWSEFEKQRAKVGPDRAKQMMAGMVARFQGLQMQREDKDLFDIRLQQIEVEDTEFGLVMDLSTTDKSQTEKIDKLTTELRSNAQKSVDLRLKERGLRLDRLTRFLEKEKQAYEADLKNEDTLVNDRVKLMINEGPEFFTPKRMHHGDGASTSPTTHSTSEPK